VVVPLEVEVVLVRSLSIIGFIPHFKFKCLENANRFVRGKSWQSALRAKGKDFTLSRNAPINAPSPGLRFRLTPDLMLG
jgi:hypothetical protein